MSAVVLLTGATGFLGAQIARRSIQKADCTIIALVRAEDHESAVRRLSRAWWDWRELAEAIGTRVHVVCGDVTAPRLGVDAPTDDALLHEVTHSWGRSMPGIRAGCCRSPCNTSLAVHREEHEPQAVQVPHQTNEPGLIRENGQPS